MCPGANTIIQNVAFGVKWAQSRLVYSLTIDVVVVCSETHHVTTYNLLVKQAVAVLVMSDGLSQDGFLDTFSTFPTLLPVIAVHLGAEANELGHLLALQLVLKLSKDHMVGCGEEGMVGW